MKTVAFSETIAACDLKVGRCRQLIEIMKVISLPYIFQVLYVLCFTNFKISGERLQDQWSSGYEDLTKIIFELSSNIIKYAPYFFCCSLALDFESGANCNVISIPSASFVLFI